MSQMMCFKSESWHVVRFKMVVLAAHVLKVPGDPFVDLRMLVLFKEK